MEYILIILQVLTIILLLLRNGSKDGRIGQYLSLLEQELKRHEENSTIASKELREWKPKEYDPERARGISQEKWDEMQVTEMYAYKANASRYLRYREVTQEHIDQLRELFDL